MDWLRPPGVGGRISGLVKLLFVVMGKQDFLERDEQRVNRRRCYCSRRSRESGQTGPQISTTNCSISLLKRSGHSLAGLPFIYSLVIIIGIRAKVRIETVSVIAG